MKSSLITAAILFIGLTGCKKDIALTSITGTWKAYERLSAPADLPFWQAETEYTITINASNSYTFTPNHFLLGASGKLSLKNDSTLVAKAKGKGEYEISFKLTNDLLQLNYYPFPNALAGRFKKHLNE